MSRIDKIRLGLLIVVVCIVGGLIFYMFLARKFPHRALLIAAPIVDAIIIVNLVLVRKDAKERKAKTGKVKVGTP